MVQWKGLFYRKLRQFFDSRKKERKEVKKDIGRGTRQAVKKIKSFLARDRKKVEHSLDEKFDQIMENLHVLNKLNKTIINQTRSLIKKLRKRSKDIISV